MEGGGGMTSTLPPSSMRRKETDDLIVYLCLVLSLRDTKHGLGQSSLDGCTN
jgi:hypothetical protein